MMKFERCPQGMTEDQVHSVRITLSSKNVKNLEKVCAELVNGAKDKRLNVKGDEVMPENVTPITTRSPFEPGFYSPRPYQRQNKKGGTNFRWSPEMSRFLLPILVDQANMGLKMGRTFRRDAFQAAAEAVTEKFKLHCTVANVENHLRTIKTRFRQIRKLQSFSNTVWDEKERTITMDEKDYTKYIAVNPRDEPFLNKRIELYDEMLFICGHDQAFDSTASGYAKENHSGEDVNIVMDDDDLEIEEVGEATPAATPLPPAKSPPPPSSKSPQVSTSSGSSGRTRQSGRKRKSHHPGDELDYLACQIGELAEAIRSSSRRGISEELFSAVMGCEGYDEASLGKAFDHLNEHENLARGFLVKNHNLRQAWLSDFFSVGGQML
ncbi:uncharacterized protein M6B38_259030 [Iris pallida]|uniref:Myb/SANT-like domain-containing protein n=1 Tax=Iris pallida TaxID=29817 RepID=A0AAX6IEH6_IRIPA|nr:uncharacterized protein M6B38_259030 [Iris pallida]